MINKWVILDSDNITNAIRGENKESHLRNGQSYIRLTEENNHLLTKYKKYTAEEIQLLDSEQVELKYQSLSTNPVLNYSIANNKTEDGKLLYTKIHGVKAFVAAGESHTFQLTIPYAEAYFQGAETLVDIIGVSDFTIDHPVYGVLEQYGYDVNMGTIKYIRESKYAARLPMGLIIKCAYTNDTSEELEVGVNFLLHEIRS